MLMAATLFVLGGSASLATTVTSSALDHIVITPNDRPTIVDVGEDQQFLATGYSADERALDGITFTWSADGNVGTVAENGFFTGVRGGIGRVTATSGGVSASVGVVVSGVEQPAEPKPEPAAPITPPSSTTTQNVNVADNTNTTTPTEAEAGEETDNSGQKSSATTTGNATCTTIRAWLWVLILIVYCVILVAYFLSLGESRTMWWWIVPAVLTVASFALFFGTRCGGINAWIPWTLGVLAILLGLFYVRVLRPTENTPIEPRN